MSASLVGSEMCIRDRFWVCGACRLMMFPSRRCRPIFAPHPDPIFDPLGACLLYTSDAADDM
eukprot:5470569-Alexandrium_andersonii.AAC.1